MPIALSKYICLPAQESGLLTCFLTLTCSVRKVIVKVRTFRDDSDGAGNMWVQNGFLLPPEALWKAFKSVGNDWVKMSVADI